MKPVIDTTSLSARPESHSVNVLEYSDGRLLATWYTGSYEGCEDQVGVGAWYDAAAQAWSKPIVICEPIDFEGERYVTEQLCPFETADGGTLMLTWGISLNLFELAEHRGARRWRRPITEIRSFCFDWDGKDRSNIRPLIDIEGNDPADQMLFQGQAALRDPEKGPAGGWIVPYEFRPDPHNNPNFHSRFLFIDSDGKAMRRNPEVSLCNPWKSDGPGFLEPAVARIDDKHWICLGRYGRQEDGGCIWRSDSQDGGWTFSEPVQTSLRNNHSAVDLAYDPRGGILLVAYNDSHGARVPLTIAMSEDLGKSFISRDLEISRVSTAGGVPTVGEYSYPKVHISRDGQIHLFYTYNRDSIAHARIDYDWLRQGRKNGGSL